MGDMMTLIEQAEAAFDQDQAEKAAEQLMAGTFTLMDFVEQLRAVRKMGPVKNLLGMMPGMSKELKDVDIDERELDRVEAIVMSMTKNERTNPDVLNASRRQRVAAGSGRPIAEVNALLKQFGEMQKMMKSLGPGMTQVMKGGGGKFKQARAMHKAVKSGEIDPEQLKALQQGGLPGLAPGARPKTPSLPGLSGPGRAGGSGGRATAPGTQSGPSNKKKKKKR